MIPPTPASGADPGWAAAAPRPQLRIGCLTRTYLVPHEALWATLARYAGGADTLLLPPGAEPGLRWAILRSQEDQYLSLGLLSRQLRRLTLHCQVEPGRERSADLLLDPEYPAGAFKGSRRSQVNRICHTVFEAVAILLDGDPLTPYRRDPRLPAKGGAWITIDGRTWRGELIDATPQGVGMVIPEPGDYHHNHPLGDLAGRTGLLRRKTYGVSEYHSVELIRIGVRRNGIHLGLRLLDPVSAPPAVGERPGTP